MIDFLCNNIWWFLIILVASWFFMDVIAFGWYEWVDIVIHGEDEPSVEEVSSSINDFGLKVQLSYLLTGLIMFTFLSLFAVSLILNMMFYYDLGVSIVIVIILACYIF